MAVESVGIDRVTFQPITGWDHIKQSIAYLLATPIGSRVLRRKAGAGVESRIDRPQSETEILGLYMDIATALEPRVVDGVQLGEPRFRLTQIVFNPSETGVILVELTGIEYPRGHLNDFSVVGPTRNFRVPLSVFGG